MVPVQEVGLTAYITARGFVVRYLPILLLHRPVPPSFTVAGGKAVIYSEGMWCRVCNRDLVWTNHNSCT